MKKRRILSALLAAMTAATTLIGAAGVTAAESPYKDVKTGRWSFNEIMYATENGFMNGKGGGLFAPEETMSRAMVVTVLYRFQGEPNVKYIARFKDVKKNDWFASAAMWAAEREIVNGVEPGVFAPNDNVTRQQLAAILMRYAPLEHIKSENRRDITGYSDYRKVQAYARDAMSWANATGLITGVTTSTLEPTSGATREQFAVILKRFKEGKSFDYELYYAEPEYNRDLDRSVELVTDADIYVAVDGKDTNPGTLSKPVATFARAKELVRELKKTATREIVVAFKAGNYGVLEGLVFTAEDGGSSDVPIRYTAYGDGDVIFENGVTIKKDEFKPIEDGDRYLFNEAFYKDIYKVDLSGKLDTMTEDNALFSSASGSCHEARYPNKNADGTDRNYLNMTTTVDEYSSIQLQALLPKIVSGFRKTEGMRVTGHLRTGWLIDTFTVKSYDPETAILTLDIYEGYVPKNGMIVGPLEKWDNYPLMYEGRIDDDIFFSNLSDQLDNAGEYWYDTETHVLYVYKPDGDYAVSNAGGFITVEQGADNISFVGLEFTGTTEDAFTVSGDYITVDRCKIGNISGQYVINTKSVNHLTVTNNEIYNFNCCAVNVVSDADRAHLKSAGNVISNNYMHDFGQPHYFNDAQAVAIYHDVAADVSHNVFENGAHGAVRFNESIDTVMEYNVFDNMMMTTEDFGAIYTWNSECYRGNTVRYNLFCNIRACGGAYGIYIDNFTCAMEIYGNLFYNAGDHAVCIHGGRDNEVYDNIFINANVSPLGDAVMYSNGLYEHVITEINLGLPSSVQNTEFYRYYGAQLPKEGDEGYELWRERWPLMFEYTYDLAKLGTLESVYTVINYVERNTVIGSDFPLPDGSDDCAFNKYGVYKDNEVYGTDENRLFVDPTHGDYTLVKGARHDLGTETVGVVK